MEENIMLLYTIKDNLSGFAAPIPFVNEQVAIRWFEERIKNDPNISFSPADYELWYMGRFDPTNGNIEFNEANKRIIKKGAEYV